MSTPFSIPQAVPLKSTAFRMYPAVVYKDDQEPNSAGLQGIFWQYALCMNCGTHSGWFFIAPKGASINNVCFFALITQQIV